MRIRVRDHVKLQPDRMAKIALATTERAQLDLYCVAPGQSQKPHTHGDQDKIYYVLEGRGRFRVGAEEEALEPGDATVARAGVEHGLVNDGTAPLLVLVVVTPPPPPAHVSRATHGGTGLAAPDK
jgi:quercetin dioxygenase-like cupin family protein